MRADAFRDTRLLLLGALIASMLTGCSSGSSPSDTIDAATVDNIAATNTTDITNVIFDERSADCADFADQYAALVLDLRRGLGFSADIIVTNDGATCTLISNNIPNHDFNDATAAFATNVAEVDQAFALPRNPALVANTTPLSQQSYDGVMLNGVPIDLLSAGCYSPTSPGADALGNVAIGCMTNDKWLLDPLGSESKFGADIHNAHTQPNGSYHYHGNPNAMFDDFAGPNGSPVIGFAADGFPIYGSYFYDEATGQVRKATSGYVLIPGQRPAGATDPGGDYDGLYIDDWAYAGAGDLDECNGMEIDGQYGYYVTDTYPWVLACLAGMPNATFNK